MPAPNWINAFLSNKNASYLNCLAITMSQVDDSWEADEHRIPKAEPLPFIDYNLVQKIIGVLGIYLVKREAEDYVLLMGARKFYYNAHNTFQFEHNGLEDSKAYDTIMKTQMKKLDDMGDEKDATLKEKLEWTKISIQKNEKDIEASVERVRQRWLMRTEATTAFGRAKGEFVEMVLPRLIEIGEKAGAEAADLASSLAAWVPAPIPAPAPIDPLASSSTLIPPTVILTTNPSPSVVTESKSDSSESMSLSPDTIEEDETQAAVDVVEESQKLSDDAVGETQAAVDVVKKTQKLSDDTVGETQAASDAVEATRKSSDPRAETPQAASDAAVKTATDPPRVNIHGERLPYSHTEWWSYLFQDE